MTIKKGLCCLSIVALLSLNACAKKVHELNYPPPPPKGYETQQSQFQKMLQQQQAVQQQRERELLAQQQDEEKKLTEQNLQSQKRQLQKKIDRFTSLIESGECHTAEREAHKIMQDFTSSNQELEADLLTATCLCHLKEKGDIDRFTQCSEELAEVTKTRKYLDRECQMVLELRPYFKNNSSPSRDIRIDGLISNGLANTLKTNK